MGACDDGLKLYDFDTRQLLQSFPDLYTCFCDCVKFVEPDELPQAEGEFYVLTRGVENLRDDDATKSAIGFLLLLPFSLFALFTLICVLFFSLFLLRCVFILL